MARQHVNSRQTNKVIISLYLRITINVSAFLLLSIPWFDRMQVDCAVRTFDPADTVKKP